MPKAFSFLAARCLVALALLSFSRSVFIPASSASDASIVLASTTSVENSGLLAHILPQFTQETGITVRIVAQGTGQALDTARRGDADLVLVHDPDAEKKFVSDSDGLTPRQIAWNDFIIVGPAADPAHVRGGHDSVAALKEIDETKAPFVSRGDRSGTKAMELRLWKAAGIAPDKDGAGTCYRDIGGGMGQALNAAEAMQAYTLSDDNRPVRPPCFYCRQRRGFGWHELG